MKIKLNHPQMDASENLFFSRQLEHIRAGVFEVQYPEFKGRSFLPVNNAINSAAEDYTYRAFDKYGQAKMVRDYAKDFPAVNVDGKEVTQKLRSIGASYSYSIQEARAAQMAGMDLTTRKANAARHAIEQKLDEVMLLGDATMNLDGFFLLSGTNSYTVPDPGAGKDFESKTSDEIITDLCGIANKLVDDSNGIEKPNTLLLPLSSYNFISCKRMGDSSDTSVLNHFLGISPFITRVDWSERLESNAGWTGKRMVCYNRSPDKLESLIPLEFEQMAPEFSGMVVDTKVHARTGGLALYFPQSVAYGDEI